MKFCHLRTLSICWYVHDMYVLQGIVFSIINREPFCSSIWNLRLHVCSIYACHLICVCSILKPANHVNVLRHLKLQQERLWRQFGFPNWHLSGGQPGARGLGNLSSLQVVCCSFGKLSFKGKWKSTRLRPSSCKSLFKFVIIQLHFWVRK